MMRTVLILSCMGLVSCAAVSGRPGKGGQEEISTEAKEAMARIGQKVKGQIVWSSSRNGNHDLFTMNTDGSGMKELTKGDHVDWFSRFSPDGRTILFTRSKKGWVEERDANRFQKWDLYTISSTGAGEVPKKLVKDASWGTWISDDRIQFSRGTKVFQMDLASKEETLLLDSEKEEALGGADLQQPQLKTGGRFISITLRGAKRETGVFDLEKRTWTATGEGCQINWHPSEDRIYWVNPSGNGGSEVFSIPLQEGKPTKENSYEEMRFIDIPGRRSHEYFPQMDGAAKWLVWAATQRGHDHDKADYEIYIWEIGAKHEEATRLTYHSGNDRWPDIFLAE